MTLWPSSEWLDEVLQVVKVFGPITAYDVSRRVRPHPLGPVCRFVRWVFQIAPPDEASLSLVFMALDLLRDEGAVILTMDDEVQPGQTRRRGYWTATGKGRRRKVSARKAKDEQMREAWA